MSPSWLIATPYLRQFHGIKISSKARPRPVTYCDDSGMYTDLSVLARCSFICSCFLVGVSYESILIPSAVGLFYYCATTALVYDVPTSVQTKNTIIAF